MKKLLLILLFAAPSAHAQNQLTIDSINSLAKEIYLLDQKVRMDFMNSKSNDEKALTLKRWQYQDSVNQSIIFPIMDDILAARIPADGLTDGVWDACFFVVQHADLDAQLKYQGFITQCFEKGLITGINYIIFIDRISARQNKRQPFGSQGIKLSSGKVLLYPVCTQPERDSMFHSVGIDPHFFRVVNGAVMYISSPELTKEIFDSEVLPKILSTPNNQYDLIELAANEFAVLGIVKLDEANGAEGADIKLGKQTMATTDENGFFYFKVAKKNIPNKLTVEYKDKLNAYEIERKQSGEDFILFSYTFEQ